MLRLLTELDRILRGQATRVEDLREGTVKIPLGGICVVLVVLGMIYGLCMSGYSVLSRRPFELPYLVAPMIKVPALFALTLIVTFPSLYVFNALVGSRLSVVSVLRLIVASLAVTLAVLASFGPIVAFFSFTTKSYPFMILLNVVIFTIAGVLGLSFLLQTLHRLTVARRDDAVVPAVPAARRDDAEEEDESAGAAGPIDHIEGHVLGPHVKAVFRIWIIVFGLVGAQMAWVLRPFVGHPNAEFTWFRDRESNFFQSVWDHLWSLFT